MEQIIYTRWDWAAGIFTFFSDEWKEHQFEKLE